MYTLVTPWTWLRPPHDPHHEPLPIRPARLCAPGHLPASRTHTLRLPRDLSLAVLNAVCVTWSPQARLVRFLQHNTLQTRGASITHRSNPRGRTPLAAMHGQLPAGSCPGGGSAAHALPPPPPPASRRPKAGRRSAGHWPRGSVTECPSRVLSSSIAPEVRGNPNRKL